MSKHKSLHPLFSIIHINQHYYPLPAVISHLMIIHYYIDHSWHFLPYPWSSAFVNHVLPIIFHHLTVTCNEFTFFGHVWSTHGLLKTMTYHHLSQLVITIITHRHLLFITSLLPIHHDNHCLVTMLTIICVEYPCDRHLLGLTSIWNDNSLLSPTMYCHNTRYYQPSNMLALPISFIIIPVSLTTVLTINHSSIKSYQHDEPLPFITHHSSHWFQWLLIILI